MKRYRICFFMLVVAVFGFLSGGFFYTAKAEREQERLQQEALRQQEEEQQRREQQLQKQLLSEYEKMAKEAAALNPSASSESTGQGEYYLVEENGFLLVFNRDRTTLCLHTHMPLSDFPEEEQAKLMEGIWFPSMLEVFQYLESFTS